MPSFAPEEHAGTWGSGGKLQSSRRTDGPARASRGQKTGVRRAGAPPKCYICHPGHHAWQEAPSERHLLDSVLLFVGPRGSQILASAFCHPDFRLAEGWVPTFKEKPVRVSEKGEPAD